MSSRESNFEEQGHASQFLQYDDIAIKNMLACQGMAEVINRGAFGGKPFPPSLLESLRTFHFYFANIYFVTNIESAKYLKKEEAERVKSFIYSPFQLRWKGEKVEYNDAELHTAFIEAQECFNTYQEALVAAKFRKVTYETVKLASKARQNI